MKQTFKGALAAALCVGLRVAASAAPHPVGPELAPPQVGHLLRAWPLATNTNPLAPGGIGVMEWACEYRVGTAHITLAPTTQPGDPMPCKREVLFSR